MSGNESNRKLSLRATINRLVDGEIPKPLNENLSQNRSSYLLQLNPLKLIYEEKTTKQTGKKKGRSKIYSISGFPGLIQQRKLIEMQEVGIEPYQPLSDERCFSAQVSLSEQEEP